jgi:hypothetical protein
MAILGVLTNALVLVNGVDLSDHVEKVTVSDERSKVPITAMGATANGYTKGLGDASIKLTFYQDMSAGKVHATLQPLINSATPVAVEVRGVNAARSATNPAFLLSSALMFNYSGLDGGATDNNASKTEVEFSNASSAGGMTYPTA